jgi:transcriptional regulator with PAS, ATPase and Fis domain
MIGVSPQIRKIFALVEQIAKAGAPDPGRPEEVEKPVLIVGETGTGKELIARALHDIAGKPDDRFITVNCTAIAKDLFESTTPGSRRSGSICRCARTDRATSRRSPATSSPSRPGGAAGSPTRF